MSHDWHKRLSILNPLKQEFFRTLWIANVASLIGTWMHEVGAAWLMTTLAPSPFMVAMVQTASTLPFFLLALPAGAFADIIDRRRLLIATQCWMLAISFILGIMTIAGITTPSVLLMLTFFLALGAAVNNPAWQSIIPELVVRDDLTSAIALGSVGFNIARAIGPVLGGFVVAAFGPGVTFILNAVSFLGVLIVLMRWHRKHHERTLPEERLIGAMRAGIRYVRNAPQVKAVLIHSIPFSFFGSSLWAFLPIISRQYLGLSAVGYGGFLGFFGGGAILGASLLPLLRQRVSLNLIIGLSANLYALVMIVLAYIHSYALLALAMIAGGIAWLMILSILLSSIQAVIPSWVRGRVMSVHMLVFFGFMAAGSTLSGTIAVWAGIPVTLTIAAFFLIAGTLVTQRYRLISGENLDLTPSAHWPSLSISNEPELDEGPVLVVIEYRIDQTKSIDFTNAMRALKTIRCRDGAIRWNLFHDITDPGHYIESYIIESWGEHLRQHERITVSDKEIEDRVLSFHTGKEPPIVMHFIAEPVPKEKVG